jgi:hypothetical protein
MSVLVQGEGQQLLLTKGAPESVLSRCSSALANSEPPPTSGAAAGGAGIAMGGRQVVHLTEGMRRSLMERMGQYGGACLFPVHSLCTVLWGRVLWGRVLDVHLTDGMRRSLMERMGRYGGTSVPPVHSLCTVSWVGFSGVGFCRCT